MVLQLSDSKPLHAFLRINRAAFGGTISAFCFVFHRRAAPARFAAIPTWRRRWVVGALGARPDAYTLRRIEAALVLHNGLCHSHKRQWYGRMQSTKRREKKEDGWREKQSQWSETTGKQTPQQQQGPSQAAEGMIRNKIFSLLLSLFSRCSFFPRSLFATVTSICA